MTHTEAIRVLGPLASLWPVLPPEQRQGIQANMRRHELAALAMLFGTPLVGGITNREASPEKSTMGVDPQSGYAVDQPVFDGDPVVAEGWANRPRPTPAAQAAAQPPSEPCEPQHPCPDPIVTLGWQSRPRPEPCRPGPDTAAVDEPLYHPWPDPIIAAAWQNRPRPAPYVEPSRWARAGCVRTALQGLAACTVGGIIGWAMVILPVVLLCRACAL